MPREQRRDESSLEVVDFGSAQEAWLPPPPLVPAPPMLLLRLENSSHAASHMPGVAQWDVQLWGMQHPRVVREVLQTKSG